MLAVLAVLAVLALAAVGLAVLGVLLVTRHVAAAPGATVPSPVTTSPGASPAEAHQVALALRRLTTDPESLVASASPGPVRGHANQGGPAGSTIDVDEASGVRVDRCCRADGPGPAHGR